MSLWPSIAFLTMCGAVVLLTALRMFGPTRMLSIIWSSEAAEWAQAIAVIGTVITTSMLFIRQGEREAAAQTHRENAAIENAFQALEAASSAALGLFKNLNDPVILAQPALAGREIFEAHLNRVEAASRATYADRHVYRAITRFVMAITAYQLMWRQLSESWAALSPQVRSISVNAARIPFSTVLEEMRTCTLVIGGVLIMRREFDELRLKALYDMALAISQAATAAPANADHTIS